MVNRGRISESVFRGDTDQIFGVLLPCEQRDRGKLESDKISSMAV